MTDRTIVVSQPMIFPWAGMLEQVRRADVFVHYDDVQLPQGRSFITRVQIKTAQGVRWLSVPIERHGAESIANVKVDDGQPWRKNHLESLRHAYGHAPFGELVLEMARTVLEMKTPFLAELNIASIEVMARYFGFKPRFLRSGDLNISGHSTERLLAIVQHLEGTKYLTGHGARNYLAHELFAEAGISVEYMQYNIVPYPQAHGPFTPYVTGLDLLANVGTAGIEAMQSTTVPWQDFVEVPNA